MYKLLKNLIVFIIIIVFSPSILASETLDVSGFYIGEQHGNPVNAQGFINTHKTGQQIEKFCLLGCTKKKERGYFVFQNINGVHIWVIEKNTWFSSMKLNAKGE